MRRAGRIALLASLVLVPLVPLPAILIGISCAGDPPGMRPVHDFDLPKWAVAGCLLAAIAAMVAVAPARRRGETAILPPGSLPLWILVLTSLASMAWSTNPHEAALATIRLATVAGFYVAFAFALDRDLALARRISMALAVTGLAIAAYGIAQKAGWDFASIPWRHLKRPVATLGNTNIASKFLVVVIPFLLAGVILARRGIAETVLLVGCLAALLHLALTETRAGWISLGAALATGGVLLVRARREGPTREPLLSRKKALGLALLPLALAACLAIPGIGGGKVLREAASIPSTGHPSTRVRMHLWKATGSMFLDHLVAGVGAGNFRVEFPRYRMPAEMDLSGYLSRVDTAHNDYLEIAAELGAAGILLWLLFLARVGLAGLRRSREESDASREGTVLHAAAGASMAAFAVNLALRSPLHNPSACVAFAAAAAIWTRGSVVGPRVSGAALRAVPLLALAALPLVWSPVTRFAADRRLRQALGWQEVALAPGPADSRRALERARDAVVRGLDADPASFELLSRLGRYQGLLGTHDLAADTYRAALALRPHDPLAMASLAVALARSDVPAEAMRLLETAREMAPSHPVIRFNEGVLLQGLERWREAIFAFEQAASFRPRHARTYEALRDCYERLDPRAYRTLLFHAEAMRQLCDALDDVDAGEREEAIDLLKGAVELAPEAPEPRFVLEVLLASTGSGDEGVREITAALERGLSPTSWIRNEGTLQTLLDEPRIREALAGP